MVSHAQILRGGRLAGFIGCGRVAPTFWAKSYRRPTRFRSIPVASIEEGEKALYAIAKRRIALLDLRRLFRFHVPIQPLTCNVVAEAEPPELEFVPVAVGVRSSVKGGHALRFVAVKQ